MPLAAAIEDALAGRGLRVRGAAPPLAPPLEFERHRGRLVFWPLSNEGPAVWRLLSALRAGIVPVLLPPRVPAARRADLAGAFPRYGHLTDGRIEVPADAARADPRLFIVFLTSGSTGAPRLVAATAGALAAGVAGMHATQGLAAIAATAVVLPLHFAYAFINQLLWAVHYRRELVVTPGLAFPAATFRATDEAGAGMVCLASAQVRALRRLGLPAGTRLPRVKVVNVAAGPFPAECFGLLRGIFPGAHVINNYGCTEALTRVACREVTAADQPAAVVGAPLPGVEVRVAGPDDPGPLEFRGPSASVGLVRPDGGIDEFAGWVPTGDLGRVAGGVVHVFGRHDQVFKAGGERLSLVEVEQALARLAGVADAAAWVCPDGGHALAAVHGTSPPGPAELRRRLRASLPPPAWPARIFWAAAWPCLPNGKTDRRALRAAAESGALPLIWENPRRESPAPQAPA